ncbi:hypothetical protein AC578_9289 [Pseudocercospora eumusae]|uniref:NAD(P)-binding protein n=1 Tax=Pseudocercospora eumusae TaxID=321146 RepID=A0A139HNL8_9PEZI|nr:hypothetical protein AC578_9289 [Pseudocercospora eumusae]
MPVAVVTGANSGIGHAFANILISEGYEVHAADVNVGEKLQSLQCRLHRLDVTQPESIAGFATQLAGKPVDVLLNVAGILAPQGQDDLATITKETLTKIFEVNAFGPLLLTQALLPNLLESSNPRVGIVSSRVGSMGDNSTGGNYAYRASKAAVNSFGKNLAVELQAKNVVVSLLHPGIVRTGLNPNTLPGPETVEPEEAATKLWAVFLSKSLDETGRFWHREGYELPW